MERKSPDIVLLLNDNTISDLISKKISERFQKNHIIHYSKLSDILNNMDYPSIIIFSAQLDDADALDLDEMLGSLLKKFPQSEYIAIDCPPEYAIYFRDAGVLSSFVDWKNHELRIYEIIELALLKISAISLQLDSSNYIEFDSIKVVCADEVTKIAYSAAQKLAKKNIPILITGETGVGKEFLAKYIHFHSYRKDKPYEVINATSLSAELFESKLYGHKKGAFTGATFDKKGSIDTVNGGTLFIDEITKLSSNLQHKLLRFVQFGEYSILGDTKTKIADIGIIAGGSEINKLNIDLFNRFQIIELPSLALIKNSINILIDYFLLNANKENNVIKVFSPDALIYLKEQEYPGNIRQLKMIIDRVHTMADTRIIDLNTVQQCFKAYSKYNPSAY
jgi:DNA-binding NtrC family response regulator